MKVCTNTKTHLGNVKKWNSQIKYHSELVSKNVLITGATGQLGSELKDLIDIDNKSLFQFFYTGSKDLDITQLEEVDRFVDKFAIDYIINCAAYTMVDLCEADIDLCNSVNYKGAENLAKVASKSECKLIHISTDYVFDGESETPYTEDSQVNPLSVYGKAKVKAEETVKLIAPDSIIIRTAWLYSSYKINFVKTMLRLMDERDELTIVNDQHGTPTYARDLAEAILIILDAAENGGWKEGIYHFSNLGATTWFGFAKKIKSFCNIEKCKLTPIETKDYPTAAVRPPYTVLDKTKIQDTFSFIIPKWEKSLERFLTKLN